MLGFSMLFGGYHNNLWNWNLIDFFLLDLLELRSLLIVVWKNCINFTTRIFLWLQNFHDFSLLNSLRFWLLNFFMHGFILLDWLLLLLLWEHFVFRFVCDLVNLNGGHLGLDLRLRLIVDDRCNHYHSGRRRCWRLSRSWLGRLFLLHRGFLDWLDHLISLGGGLLCRGLLTLARRSLLKNRSWGSSSLGWGFSVGFASRSFLSLFGLGFHWLLCLLEGLFLGLLELVGLHFSFIALLLTLSLLQVRNLLLISEAIPLFGHHL
jgi:hypothetical protein